MLKVSIIVIPLLLTLSGCAMFSSQTAFSPVEGLSQIKVSPRTVPAKISSESESVLKSKGYARIGYISSTDETGSCWGDDCKNFTCSGKISSKDMTKEILEAAAASGGDLVVLQQDKAVSSRSASRNGKCLSSTQSQYTEQQCSGGYGNVARVCSNVTKTRYTCVSWETVFGRECITNSSGAVWRQEPGLENRLSELQRATAEVRRENEQREKALKEKKDKVLASYSPQKKKKGEKVETAKDQLARISAYEKAYDESMYTFQKDELKSVKVGGKYGFQDRNGKTVIEPQFTDTMHGFSDGVAVVAVGVKKEQRWGIINKKGKWVIEPTYEHSMNKPSNGMIKMQVKDKCGYLNTKGEVVIPAQFSTCWDFSEGMAAVRPDVRGNVGYINKAGKIVIEPAFDLGGSFSEGIAAAKLDGKYGYIDKKGNIVIRPQFDSAEICIDGIARVTNAYKRKYVTSDGDLYMEP